MKSLSAQHLVKKYGSRSVVNGVSFSVASGEIVGLLGPNGAGKTTSFYAVVGLISPDSGSVLLGGDDITGMPMYQRARRGVGYLAQEPSVFRKLTVSENIRAVLEFMDISSGEMREREERVVSELGIEKLTGVKAYALSGGERRRVEIARALAVEPEFLLLDEPFSGIDPIAVADIQDIVIGLKKKGIGILITDHNVGATLGICDRAYIIDSGEILKAGTPAEIVESKEVREAYLGDRFKI